MKKPKILILFYSMRGHIFEMAKEIAKGVEEAGGEAVLRQTQELIPEDKWDDGVKKAKETMKDIPIANPHSDIEGVDGVIVGLSARFGNMPAQMRNFWDQTSGGWMKGTLIGKPVSMFTSTATQHGGQESTILSSLITALHHGMIFVGFPYSFKEQMTIDEIAGGSPYGVATISGGMGERMPSDLEKKMTRDMGAHHTKIAAKLM
ncbi:MAG: NAD(P)H:quinone oxidoreductase type IV [Candidatus Paceibacteria bacterium]